MAHRNGALAIAALSLTALGLMTAPVCAFAQEKDPANNADTGSNDQLNKPINLDVRSANLYYALTLLFDQLKIGNYTLPDSLKQFEVSAHFTSLPLRTALETLLKNSGYTYKVDGGVYSVVPKNVELSPSPLPQDTPPEAPIKGKKIFRITGSQIIYNSVDIVTRLGGRVLPSSVGSGTTGTGGAGGNGLGGLGGGLNGGLGSFGGSGLGGLGGGLGSFGGSLGGGMGNNSGIGGGIGNYGGNLNGGNGNRGGRGF
jgi:hypothetical protein